MGIVQAEDFENRRRLHAKAIIAAIIAAAIDRGDTIVTIMLSDLRDPQRRA